MASMAAISPVADDLLDREVSDKAIATIAKKYLDQWEDLHPFLELAIVTKETIRRTPGDYEEQKKAFLREWRKQNGHGATLRALITAANEADNKKLADDILKHYSSGMFCGTIYKGRIP